MKKFSDTLGFLAAIGLVLVGLWWGNKTYWHYTMADFWALVQLPTPAASTPPPSAQDVATAISAIEPTPGTGGNGQLPTAIPWQTKFQLGDQAMLAEAIHSLYGTSSFDLRISTVNAYGGVGVYCIAQYIPWFGTPAWDYQTPLAQIVNGKGWLLFPGSRYCSIWLIQGELWGGVVQSHLQNAPVYSPETKPATNPGTAWVLLTPAEHRTDDATTSTTTVTQTVSVELHLPFGLLTSSVQPKNQVKKTLGDPPSGSTIWMINTISKQAGKPEFQTVADGADTFSRWLAQYDLIAPIGPNGERDMAHLNQLKTEMDVAFNNPAPRGQIWPYDNLRAQFELLVKQAGYQGIDSFKVVLEWPTGQTGVWCTLESMATGGCDPVVKPDDLAFNRDNLYVLFKSDVQSTLTWDAIPEWARATFHLP